MNHSPSDLSSPYGSGQRSELDPRHSSRRTFLRTAGWTFAAVGVIGMFSSLSSFFRPSSMFEPRTFSMWLFAFAPLLGVGVLLLRLGYMGVFVRHFANETAPVAADFVDYMRRNRISEHAQDRSQCASCNAPLAPKARFCSECGTSAKAN